MPKSQKPSLLLKRKKHRTLKTNYDQRTTCQKTEKLCYYLLGGIKDWILFLKQYGYLGR